MTSLRELLAALFGAGSTAAGQPKAVSNPSAELMREMRLQWLTSTSPTAPERRQGAVSVVLMDWPIDDATVTVLASALGDASIYTTGTFGILGGIGHEEVRKAALAFAQCAQKHLVLMSPTTDFSYPDCQHVKFFAVTEADVRSVSFAAAEAHKTGTAACDLCAHGQAVLTEMRQIMQNPRLTAD